MGWRTISDCINENEEGSTSVSNHTDCRYGLIVDYNILLKLLTEPRGFTSFPTPCYVDISYLHTNFIRIRLVSA